MKLGEEDPPPTGSGKMGNRGKDEIRQLGNPNKHVPLNFHTIVGNWIGKVDQKHVLF